MRMAQRSARIAVAAAAASRVCACWAIPARAGRAVQPDRDQRANRVQPGRHLRQFRSALYRRVRGRDAIAAVPAATDSDGAGGPGTDLLKLGYRPHPSRNNGRLHDQRASRDHDQRRVHQPGTDVRHRRRTGLERVLVPRGPDRSLAQLPGGDRRIGKRRRPVQQRIFWGRHEMRLGAMHERGAAQPEQHQHHGERGGAADDHAGWRLGQLVEPGRPVDMERARQ